MTEKVFIYLDGKLMFPLKYKKENNLNDIKKIISKKITSDFVFLMGNDLIEKENEEDFSLEDIINENKKVNIKVTKNKKSPLIGSIKMEKLDDIEIYSYPNNELTEIEKMESKNILFIGQSGVGKTTFLNALINVLLDITENDVIRYKLVFKETKEGQFKSQTDKINIYNIKIPGKPILRLIDSPGFIDTQGKEKDEKYFQLFKDLFKNQIAYLNCICFVLKSSDIRYNETQKEVFDKVSSLFSNDIQNNFVFILTNYTYTGEVDARESINQNNVFKEMINADNTFKLDSECAFSGEKEIRNIMWKKTIAEIKNLISLKFYILDQVNTAQSAKVIEKRKEHKMLFDKKLIEFKNILKEIRNLMDGEKRKSLNFNLRKSERISSITKNTICNKCKKTCEENCECNPLMELKYFCKIFGFFGFCKNCNCYLSRHSRANNKFIEKIETISFKDDSEKRKFFEKEANELKTNFEINFDDLDNAIDKSIIKNKTNIKENFFKYYNNLDSYKKLIKLKRIEAIIILLNIHNSLEALNKLALKKSIDLNLENFFNELKIMEDFKNEKDIIKKIKNEFIEYNEGKKKKNNFRFGILRKKKINERNIRTTANFFSCKYYIDDSDEDEIDYDEDSDENFD